MRPGDYSRYIGAIQKNARAEYRLFDRMKHGQRVVEFQLFEEDGERQMQPTRRTFSLKRSAIAEIHALVNGRSE